MRYIPLIIFFIIMVSSLLMVTGCDDDDDITGPDPTATPALTPTPVWTSTPVPTGTPPPTQTPSPRPTPTATPGPKRYGGTWYNTDTIPHCGTFEFTYWYPNRITGSMDPMVNCNSSEPPYYYQRHCQITFDTTTDASGTSFSFSYTSPSTTYTESFEITGTLSETEARGTWSYYFHDTSQYYPTTCRGSGDWIAYALSD